MAKFQRIGPVWRKPKPKPWQKLKACTVRANQFQFIREFDVTASSAIELIDESGVFVFITEPSSTNTPEYFVTEGS